MAKETEIKLRVSPASLATLREHPILTARCIGQWQTESCLIGITIRPILP